ncbi:MAG: Rieske 2Fe-2S domain-containing protein [Rhodobacteraceae bacterium]|nr:Rieske 2Fe-2S domain-containing protein [Paracoccaceae bacterium]
MCPTDLTGVLQPIETAHGLPNAHYVDAKIWEEEKQALLFENWSGIGLAKDIPNAGDVMPLSFVGMPLVMVRKQDGAVSVYQNTCRHRGMILVQEKGNVRGTIRCAYHSWCYGLAGELRATPHVGGPGQNIHKDVDRDELGLVEIPSHVWLDVVYVNVSKNLPSFNEVHAKLLQRWAEFDRPLIHGGADSGFKLETRCNWKLAVENYCESYHLPWIHPGLNTYSRLEDHYHIEEKGEFAGQGTTVYQQIKGDDGQAFPDFSDLSEMWDTSAEYIAVFPNVLLGVHRDHTFTMLIEPISKGQSREHIDIYYTDLSVLGADYSDLRKKNAAQWHGVLEEDIFVVDGMQQGRHGVHFDGGKFSPVMDRPTHLFHQWVADKISTARQVAAG